MRLARIVGMLALILVAATPRRAAADGSWLDGDRAAWNAAGMAIPTAPEATPPFGPCGDFIRPPETSEDRQLAAAGWRLAGGYQSGWGIRVIQAAQGFDANCRPMDYQGFIFVDGVFAGTIAPQPMLARSDGAAVDIQIWRANQVTATYTRYGPNDPLCCPASMASVNFDIQRTADGPVAVPQIAD
jgi:LppP/LprE lipoprotein